MALTMRMARKKTFAGEPVSRMNLWAREAFVHAEQSGVNLTYQDVADAMTRAHIGTTYDKSMVQKMTTMRKVSLAEAQVLAKLTGYPMPAEGERALSLDERAARLSEARRQRMLDMLADLEAAEAVDLVTRKSVSGSQH